MDFPDPTIGCNSSGMDTTGSVHRGRVAITCNASKDASQKERVCVCMSCSGEVTSVLLGWCFFVSRV